MPLCAVPCVLVLPSAPAFADGVYTLGQIIAQLGQQNTNQLRESLQGQANLMTAQDQQMTAKKKQETITKYQDQEQSCVQSAQELCSSKEPGTKIMNVAQAAQKTAMGGSLVVAAIGNGQKGNAPNLACKGKNCYGYNAGRTFHSKQEAVADLTKEKPKYFTSVDSFLPSVRNYGQAGIRQMNRCSMSA